MSMPSASHDEDTCTINSCPICWGDEEPDNSPVTTDVEPYSRIPHWLWKEASQTARDVFGCLGMWANNQSHECYPSHKTIAEKMGCSEITVKRAIKELKEIGAIKVKKRHNDSGGRTSNTYTLIFTKRSK